ncbi:MAG: UDP-2,3-diacylglucosamine diphosphatase LpxI [Alphaproteobacteria bacterium]|nr:UDP-2,3-diacylglucosamine diphosphatase LpxI [Alphaproteobacteria bacterium]
MSNAPKLGIIAGGGAAPFQVIAACKKTGREFFVMCLKGQADAELAEGAPHEWLALGAFSIFKKIIEDQGIKELVMIGRVRRPSLAEIKPDVLALKMLPRIGINIFGDDALLVSIGKIIEKETGAKIVGAHEVVEDILAAGGCLTRKLPDEVAMADIRRGVEVARELGRLDVGQSVVVQQGLVLGVEAIEGTDALISRCEELRREGLGGVLVKVAKPQQDNRYDLPAIGPDTVSAAAAAGLRGIAVEAGRSIIIEREKTISQADNLKIFIVGMKEDEYV